MLLVLAKVLATAVTVAAVWSILEYITRPPQPKDGA